MRNTHYYLLAYLLIINTVLCQSTDSKKVELKSEWVSTTAVISNVKNMKDPDVGESQQGNEKPTPWTHLEFNDSPDIIRFLVVSDRTGGMRPGVFADAVNKIILLQPEFVMSIGDLIDGYTKDPGLVEIQWKEFEDIISSLNMPFFRVPGNHDISNLYMAKEWEKRYGQSYYHFRYKDALFLCLNTEDPPPAGISPAQVIFAREALEKNNDVRWTFVFIHQPFWQYGDKQGFQYIEELLKDRPHTLFSGHNHNYFAADRHHMHYITMATTGGGSYMRGAKFGEFDHLAWVTLTDNGPKIANLDLSGITGPNVVDEAAYAFVKPLREGNWFKPIPIVNFTDRFKTVGIVIQFENQAPEELKVNGQLPILNGVVISPKIIDLAIPAGERSELKLSLENRDDILLSALPKISIELTGSYNYRDGYELSSVKTIVIDWLRLCPPVVKAIKVDGIIDEWPLEIFEKVDRPGFIKEEWDWKGPEDGFFSFATGYDSSYLYLAITSFDQTMIVEPGKLLDHQDKFYIRIDPAGKELTEDEKYDRSQEAPGVIIFGPGYNPGEPVFAENPLTISGASWACRKTQNGMAAEVAIPIELLSEIENWQNFRLNIGYMDHDNPSNMKPSVLWWKPLWNSKENYPNSGVFIRQIEE